jgi:Aspartyl protease
VRPQSSHWLIDTTVNDGYKVTAIRDCGADDTIMSPGVLDMVGIKGYDKEEEKW